MRMRLCRHLKTRRKADWAMLALLYVTAGQLIVGTVVVYSQPSTTYRFGTRYNSAVHAGTSSSADDLIPLRQSVEAQSAQIDMMNERAKFNIARLDALDKLDIGPRLAVIDATVKSLADNATDLKRLAFGIFATILAALTLQIIQVRGAAAHRDKSDPSELREILDRLRILGKP